LNKKPGTKTQAKPRRGASATGGELTKKINPEQRQEEEHWKQRRSGRRITQGKKQRRKTETGGFWTKNQRKTQQQGWKTNNTGD